MTTPAVAASSGGVNWRLPAANSVAWPLALLSALLVVQFSMIFVKSFNWDEYLHFSMLYELRAGTLAKPFQTLLMRVLSWAPHVSDDLYGQMMAARLFTWAAFLVGLGALYGTARKFVSRDDALWTMLVYLSAAYVFVHAFSIRTDPIAMAGLMLALYWFACRPVGWVTTLTVGVLVGMAGMLTLKSVFYAPCFLGLAWLRLSETEDKWRAIMGLAAIAPVAAVTFGVTYLLHRSGLAPVPELERNTASMASSLQWLTPGVLSEPKYALLAFATAPVLTCALIGALFSLGKNRADRARIVALVGLCLPLLGILVYRNVYPYFFVFILAPVAVGLALAVAELRKRYGPVVLAAAISAMPLVSFAAEPRHTIERQRALIDYVHREFPPGTVYFDDCGTIADYPRVINHPVSGVGLATYRERGIPLVAWAVESGRLAFVIESNFYVAKALAGEEVSDGLLPADVAALHGNYVRAWGSLWLAGEEIRPSTGAITIGIPRAGTYTPTEDVIVDGTPYRRGDTVHLRKGRHMVIGHPARRTVLWRGDRLPAPPAAVDPGPIFTEF